MPTIHFEKKAPSSPPRFFRWGYPLLFAVLPWSGEFSFGSWKMYLPSEPLILVLGTALVFYFLKEKKWQSEASNLLIISVLWIGWMAVCALFSSMPGVSLKYWIVEAGQWWVFGAGVFFWPDLWRRALPWLLVSAAGSVVFALGHHALYDFRPDQSNLAVMPFFPDHTLYSAVLAMLLPWVFAPRDGIVFLQKTPPVFRHSATAALAALLLAGIFFSYCRAAWVSVAAAFALGFFLFLNKKWRLVALLGAVAVAVFIFFKIENRPTADTADGNARGLAAQLRSIGNFTTDASNLERLNRYACALRMAAERPWTGFGPGTFQFQFLRFQRAEEMTRISITEPITDRNSSNYGRGGGAHSEYFQALAELGWVGLGLWLALVGGASVACWRFFKIEKWLALVVLLSLSTYFLHGLMNNFLHDGRVAALFWGQVALLAGRRFF